MCFGEMSFPSVLIPPAFFGEHNTGKNINADLNVVNTGGKLSSLQRRAETAAVMTFESEDIRPMQSNEILHARQYWLRRAGNRITGVISVAGG